LETVFQTGARLRTSQRRLRNVDLVELVERGALRESLYEWTVFQSHVDTHGATVALPVQHHERAVHWEMWQFLIVIGA